MPIQDYSTDPDLNVQISGINIAEGCPPSGINNAIRQLMADVKVESEAVSEAVSETSSALEAYAEAQAQKDAAQDTAIAGAKSSAEAASEDVTALDTALRQLIAEELQKYLPLAGGTMTGNLEWIRGSVYGEDGIYGSMTINGNKSEPWKGATVAARSPDAQDPNIVIMIARDGTNYHDVVLRPNGNFMLDGSPILAIVESWRSGDNWYRKWSDGWIEQGGAVQTVAADTIVTLHKAMTQDLYTIQLTPQGYYSDIRSASWKNRHTTNFTCSAVHGNEEYVSLWVLWTAQGY